MKQSSKKDPVLARLEKIEKKIELIHKVLLDLTAGPTKTIGRKRSAKVSNECPMSGCEDICVPHQD